MKNLKYLMMVLVAMLIIVGNASALTLKLTSPKGGETWIIGHTKPITWNYNGPDKKLKLELLKGKQVWTIAENIPARQQKFQWKVGEYIGGKVLGGEGYKIRAQMMSSTESDGSNASFTLANVLGVPVEEQKPQPQKLTASTKRPILIKYDPKQKLQELQAAEDRKKTNRQLALKAEVNKLVQEDMELTKTKKQAEICASPKIYYSLRKEVYPGDSIFIKGCGFGISKGMVTISPFNKQLEIDYWSDGGISGKIPVITGFADPQAITLKVISYQGQASDPYASLTLKPDTEIHVFTMYNLPQPTISSGVCHYTYSVGTVEHINPKKNQPCQGVDIVLQGMQLRNNWVFHSIALLVVCAEGEGEIKCSDIGSWAKTVQNWMTLVGRSTIPKIEIEWAVGPVRPQSTLENRLIYGVFFYVSGPAGTSHQ